jgi:adenylate kinase family enzyme
MRRIVVVGTSGSGKTALARGISRRLAIPHVELDALHWEPNWTMAPPAVLRERVAQAVGAAAWVVDGNYAAVRDLVWSRADSVVWLDFVLPVILWQLARRTFTRVVTQEALWSGNRERLTTALFSRDSIFLWALQTYRKHREEYPRLLSHPEHAHLTAVRLRSPRAARAWLSSLSPDARGRAP